MKRALFRLRARVGSTARLRPFILLTLLMLATAAGCGDRGSARPRDTTALADSARAAAQSAGANDRPDRSPVLDTVLVAITRHKLLRIDAACVVVERDDSRGPVVSFTVRERHGGPCAGDPQTSPRLFSIAVDTTTWSLSTDARSATATMEPLREVPR